jgi:RNA polymerase sigma-70 factor (ECF subfamily)
MRERSTALEANTAVFASVLERTQIPLRSFVRGLVGSAEQASDIVQDVFVDAWRTAQLAKAPFEGDSDEPAIRRWLFHVAYCRAAAVWRHNRVLQFESLDVTPAPEVDRFNESEPFEDRVAESELLCKSLAELGPQDTACLLLNVVQGFTAWVIASFLDISLLAAKKRVSRAKQRLREAYFAENVGERTEVRR